MGQSIAAFLLVFLSPQGPRARAAWRRERMWVRFFDLASLASTTLAFPVVKRATLLPPELLGAAGFILSLVLLNLYLKSRATRCIKLLAKFVGKDRTIEQATRSEKRAASLGLHSFRHSVATAMDSLGIPNRFVGSV